MSPEILSDRSGDAISREIAPQRGLASPSSTTRKISIILPAAADWRTVRRAAEIGGALRSAVTVDGRANEIVFGLPDASQVTWLDGETYLRKRVPGTVVRHVEWVRIPVANARRMFFDFPPNLDLEGIEDVSLPRDWGWNFQDCDCWVILADPAQGAVLPLRPTIFYCSGLPERYVPTVAASSLHDQYWDRQVEAFRVWRQTAVIASDPDTLNDLAGYAGVRRARLEWVPDPLDGLSMPEAPMLPRAENRVTWCLSGNALDDLSTSLEGLSIYRREGGRLEFVIVSDDAQRAYRHPQRKKLAPDLRALYDGLEKQVFRSLEQLYRILVGARVYWSTHTAGGTSDHLHEAQLAGLVLLAPEYPLNRRDAARLGVPTALYKRNDPTAISDALHCLERQFSRQEALNASDRAVPDERERNLRFGFVLDRTSEQARVG